MTDSPDPKDEKITELEKRLKELEDQSKSKKRDATEEIADNTKWIRIALGFLFLMMAIATISGACGELLTY